MTTRRERPDRPEATRVVGGIPIPERWTVTRPLTADVPPIGSYTLAIQLDDNDEPGLVRFSIDAAGGRPIPAARLGPADVGGLVNYEFRKQLEAEAQRQRAEAAGGFIVLGDREQAEITAAVRSALGQNRKRGSRVDDAFLTDLVKSYEDRGIKAVVSELDVTERTVRRWLKLAKDRGLR